jgi:hypothetical protein
MKTLNRLMGRPTQRVARVGLSPMPADSQDPGVGDIETGEESRRTPVSSSSLATAPPAKVRVPPCSP